MAPCDPTGPVMRQPGAPRKRRASTQSPMSEAARSGGPRTHQPLFSTASLSTSAPPIPSITATPTTPPPTAVRTSESPVSSTMSSPSIITPAKLDDPFGDSHNDLSTPGRYRLETDATSIVGESGPKPAKRDVAVMSIELGTSTTSSSLQATQYTLAMPSDSHRPGVRAHERARSAPASPSRSRRPQQDSTRMNADYRVNHAIIPEDQPIYMSMLNFIQGFMPYTQLPGMDHEKFQQYLHVIGNATTKCWDQAIRAGLIPKRVPVGSDNNTGVEVKRDFDRGRELERDKKKQRHLSPSKAVVVYIKRHIHSDLANRNPRLTVAPFNRSITAGELAEAGVYWRNVERRLQRQELDIDELMSRATTDLPNRSIVPVKHWLGTIPKSHNNPTGRNLMIYCLWEICRCDQQISYLTNILNMAGTGEQGDYNRAALRTEQGLHNYLKAIALEIDPETEDYDGTDTEEEEPADDHNTNQIDHTNSPLVVRPAKQSNKSGPRIKLRSASSDQCIRALNFKPTNPDIYFKQLEYIRDDIRLRANALLAAAGHDALDHTFVTWRPIHDALENAGVGVGKRNELIMDLNVKFHLLEAEESQLNRGSVQDIESYPTRLEIWHKIPPHGFSTSELREMFPDVDFGCEDWQKLVKSVATYQDGRWTANEQLPGGAMLHLPPGFGPSRKITLKVAHNPEEFSSRAVTNTRGFRWRFTNCSTLSQRQSMDEVIADYVEDTIANERIIQTSGLGAVYSNKGRYEMLVHPDDRDGGALVHGLWDVAQSRATEAPEWQWFFNEEPEVDTTMKKGYKTFEPIFQGTVEEFEAWLCEQKRQQTEREAASRIVPSDSTPAKTSPATSKSVGSSRVKASNKKKAANTSVNTVPSTPTKQRKGKRGKAEQSEAANSPTGGSRKRKTNEQYDDSPRSKRGRTTINYAEGLGAAEDSD